jgi:hypothetical protein
MGSRPLVWLSSTIPKLWARLRCTAEVRPPTTERATKNCIESMRRATRICRGKPNPIAAAPPEHTPAVDAVTATVTGAATSTIGGTGAQVQLFKVPHLPEERHSRRHCPYTLPVPVHAVPAAHPPENTHVSPAATIVPFTVQSASCGVDDAAAHLFTAKLPALYMAPKFGPTLH